MNGLVATRNTCFAIISAIESDFRSLFIALGDPVDLLPLDVRESAARRRKLDVRLEGDSAVVSDVDLLPYIDFADVAKITESKIASRHETQRTWLVDAARRLVALAPARNRVCHSRPLEMEDLPGLVDFSDHLLSQGCPFPFLSLSQVRERLGEEPGFVFTLQIPSYWTERAKIHHNLPIPEFDETGFVGRQADRMQVLKLLKSHYPVVTIVGEGGIGKTALALRCLYDVLDAPDGFDAIIWVSLKSTTLTAAGVRQLNGAITSTLGLLSEVAKQLGATVSSRSEDEYIDEIIEYLGLYKILIAIDNLETISVGPLRDLLLRVPSTSKVLLTSRVGLGEFEARYALQGLEDKAAVVLMRSLARVLAVAALQKMDDGNLKGYSKKLFHNPLLIKWFVAGVARGADANSLVASGGTEFSAAIAFCFQNLYERLGNPERAVVACLASARRPLTSAEMHFLMPELSALDLEVALIALHNSSIVVRTKNGTDGFEYSLSDSTTGFVGRHAPPNQDFFMKIQAKLQDLRIVLVQESVRESRYELDPFFVRSGEGRDERICATYLRRSLDGLRRGDFDYARREVVEARRLAPQSGEAARIAGLVEERSGDFYQAYRYYDEAVDLDASSRISRYCFGMFLMNDMGEVDGAMLQFEAALKLDEKNPTLLTAMAMALTRIGQFSKAAAIHEELLASIATRERRWRLTGVDQAADCYRRWGFRAWEQKEYSVAQGYFRRAMTIIENSAALGDVDDKLLGTVAKILGDGLSRREFSEPVGYVEALVSSAERIQIASGKKSIPFMSGGWAALKNIEWLPALRARLMSLDRDHTAAREINESIGSGVGRGIDYDGRRRGTVHNLQVSFGFLVEGDGSRLFFHKNSLRPELPWEDLRAGQQVMFSLGENEKGPCAIDIGLIS